MLFSRNDQRKGYDQTSLIKLSQKKELRKASTNAFKQFLRRPSSQSIVETVSKVADKAATMVDQSLNSSINENSVAGTLTSSLSSIASLSSYLNNNETSLIEFNNCLNKLGKQFIKFLEKKK